MVVIYDKAKFQNFWQALKAGDYVISHRMSFANCVAERLGYITPIHMISEEV